MEEFSAEDWFKTSDRGVIKDRALEIFGRSDDLVKVNGEGVDLQKLRQIFAKDSSEEFEILALTDERKGSQLVLVVSGESDQWQSRFEHFNRQVMPFERLDRWQKIAEFPKNELGKILRGRLIEQISR